jgi:hypothetical protein
MVVGCSIQSYLSFRTGNWLNIGNGIKEKCWITANIMGAK